MNPVFVPGPGHWTASFANVTGPAGLRHIRALAADTPPPPAGTKLLFYRVTQ